MEFTSAFKLAHQILSERSDYKKLLKTSHNKHFQALSDGAKILFPLFFQGQEPIALSVINSKWKIHAVEPHKEFLFTAIKRVEALDLESRVLFFDHPLEHLEETGYQAAFTTIAPNLLSEVERQSLLEGMATRLAPGGRMTITALFTDDEALAAWKGQDPEASKDIGDLLKVAPPINKQELIEQLEGLGLKSHWSWGKSGLLEVLHFKKG